MSGLKINIFFKAELQEEVRKKERFLKKLAGEVLHRLKTKNFEVSLIITDSIGIRMLNKKFFSRNRLTDVIAFNHPPPKIKTLKGPIPFGDIFICSDRAKKQALKMNHSFLKELAVLTVHGCLHLLGLDDKTKKERANMDKKTDFYIKKYFSSSGFPA